MFFEKVLKTQNTWEKFSLALSATILIGMMLLTSADVFLRYVFDSPIIGALEFSEMLMIGVVYLAIAYVQQKKGHVKVDFLVDKLSERERLSLELGLLVLALAVIGLLAFQSTVTTIESWRIWDVAPGIVHFPYTPFRAIIAIGTWMLVMRLIVDIGRNLAQWKKLGFKLDRNVGITAFFVVSPFLVLVLQAVELSKPATGWVFISLMTLLILLGMPVAFAILVTALPGYWLLAGSKATFMALSFTMYSSVASYTLTVIPLFILMGNFAYFSGLVNDAYTMASIWLRRFPGGLAQGTVVAGACLAAACGSGIASCAALSKICLPSMLKQGIQKRLAFGSVAAIGPIATMIPPSITLVVYGYITETSIVKMLIAGIIPGITFAVVMMAMIFIRCKINPSLAPLHSEPTTWGEKFSALGKVWGVVAIVVLVMGGIYAGIFTPTEAGAVGAIGVGILCVVNRRMKMKNFLEAASDAAKTGGMILFVIASSFFFVHFLGMSRIPENVSVFLSSLDVPRIYILIGFIIFYVICGLFFDMLAILFLTMPVIFPTMMVLGYDPVWFGIITVMLMELAMITPPFGLNLFVLKGTVPDADMKDIIMGTQPFALAYFGTLALLIIFPQIALFLPGMM